MQEMISAQRLAALLELPIATIYTWRSRGQGPIGYRVGRHVRYRMEDVEAWLATQRDKPRTAA